MHNLRRMAHYVYQQKDWPQFYWDNEVLVLKLSDVRNKQGRLLGKMENLGFDLQNEAMLKTLSADVVHSSQIEGEYYNPEEVRSSVARKLGMEFAGMVHSNRFVDGVAEVTVDATKNADVPLTKERLCAWHAALFPTGKSGMFSITVGDYRKDDKGPMQVVSGAMGLERVHFEAPKAQLLQTEMNKFLNWFNSDVPLDGVLKAAVAHFWFVTLHPFDDGNGRLARAIADMQLAKSENVNQRFYSMSTQLLADRKDYYKQLELAQKGDLDLTAWMVWFLDCLHRTLNNTEHSLSMVLTKAKFWEKHQQTVFNKRQVDMLNKLLDNFNGKLTTSKWAKMQKCSQDTALRDVQDLVEKNVLEKENAGGRSTSYHVKLDETGKKT